MNKLILAMLLLSISYAQGTFNAKNQCTCSQLTIQQDCVQSSPQCVWNSQSSSCSTTSCSNLVDQTNCAINLKCMWNGKSCVDFTFCNQLTGVDQAECYAKSQNCPQSDGKTCQGYESLKSCSSYTSSDSCAYALSNDGFCQWIPAQNGGNGNCQVISSCDELNSHDCGLFPSACDWKFTPYKCVQIGCGNFYSNSTCTYYQPSLNKQEYQLCQWASSEGPCQNASSVSSLDINTCYSDSKQTYRWVSSSNKCEACSGNSDDSNKCNDCSGKVIYILILGILMIMI